MKAHRKVGGSGANAKYIGESWIARQPEINNQYLYGSQANKRTSDQLPGNQVSFWRCFSSNGHKGRVTLKLHDALMSMKHFHIGETPQQTEIIFWRGAPCRTGFPVR